ncbi:MAG: DUF2652 domain-containing protein [Bacteroidia bacterium]|nr:DUF2652 domain-containing protein [Bacteroidia bacterium]
MPSSKSLIFLPDISGFTDFVNQTELEHSQHIIAELLEILIDANEIDMTLAEIEGDALFYYKHQDLPGPDALIKQIRKMFILFHNHLRLYEKRRICNCGSCSNAMNLTLKFIVHGGEFNFISVKDSQKPFGKDIILAHRLMKNNVPIDDYALISEEVYKAWGLDKGDAIDEELPPIIDSYTYKDAGKVDFSYLSLKPLKGYIADPPEILLEDQTDNPLVLETDIDSPRQEIFELISNFDYRLTYSKDLDKLEYDEGKMNRVGSKHSCILNGQFIEFETVKSDFGEGKWVYGEKTVEVPFMKDATNYFILEESEEGKTNVRFEAHLKPKNILGRLISPFIRSKLKKSMKELLINLKEVAKENPALKLKGSKGEENADTMLAVG